MRNPIRRSRKIGKTQGGRVKDGRPEEKWSRVFHRDIWTRLSQDTPGDEIRILRDHPSSQLYHPCSGEEYLEVLERLPEDQTDSLRAIVLRRTSKCDLAVGIEARRRYFCVLLNAFPKSNRMVWKPPPTEAQRRHHGRWCSKWRPLGDSVELIWSRDEIRRYYLYHLFLHELGHINQPWTYKGARAEAFAENYALEWAAKLGELPPPRDS